MSGGDAAKGGGAQMRSWFRWTVWGFCSFAIGFGAQLQWANSSQWMWWNLAALAALVGLVERFWDKTLVPWWKAACSSH